MTNDEYVKWLIDNALEQANKQLLKEAYQNAIDQRERMKSRKVTFNFHNDLDIVQKGSL